METKDVLETYFAVRRIINIVAVNELKELGISPKKAAVLRITKEYPNISLSCLSGMTVSDPSTITRIIDSLTKQGLIIRKDSKEDRRAFVLSLSEKGEKLAEIVKIKHENIAETVFDCLSQDEQKTLKNLLKKIVVDHNSILKKG